MLRARERAAEVLSLAQSIDANGEVLAKLETGISLAEFIGLPRGANYNSRAGDREPGAAATGTTLRGAPRR